VKPGGERTPLREDEVYRKEKRAKRGKKTGEKNAGKARRTKRVRRNLRWGWDNYMDDNAPDLILRVCSFSGGSVRGRRISRERYLKSARDYLTKSQNRRQRKTATSWWICLCEMRGGRKGSALAPVEMG